MSDEETILVERFVSQFFQASQKFSNENSTPSTFALGDETVQLSVDDRTEIGSLIRGSFISSELDTGTFTLQIWDSSKADSLPDLTWAHQYLNQDIAVPRSHSRHFRIAFDKSQGFIFVYDPVQKLGSIWIRPVSQVALASFITPFRLMMSWMADDFGGEIIHASAIGVGDKGVLINGPTGSGKSTLGLYAALQGYPVLADDVALLYKSKIYSLYTRAKAQSSSSPLSLSGLNTFEISDAINGKTIIPLSNFEDKFLRSIDLRVLILPIFAYLNHFERIQPSIALKLLAPNSLREIMGGSPENFLRLSRLTRTTPSYRLALSDNLEINFNNLLKIVQES